MRDLWNQYRSDLEKSLSKPEAAPAFASLAERCPPIKRLREMDRLVWHLADERGDLDEKDAIYAALVNEVRSGGVARDVARTLVWLGLWGGIDHAYHSLLRRYPLDRDGVEGGSADRKRALVSDVIHHVNRLIDSIDPARVRRIAADIVRSTPRDVKRDVLRTQQRASTHDELPEDASDEADGRRRPCPSQLRTDPREDDTGIESIFDIPRHLPFDEQVTLLRERLQPVVGDDTDLVVHVRVLDGSQEDFAKARGLKPATVRQRLGRAQDRLRCHAEKVRRGRK